MALDDPLDRLREAMQQAADQATRHANHVKAEAKALLKLSDDLAERARLLQKGADALQAERGAAPPKVAKPRRQVAPVRTMFVEPTAPPEPEATEPEAEPGERIEVPVRAKVTSADPRVIGDETKASGTKGTVRLITAAMAARELGTFRKREFAEAVGVSVLGATKWLRLLVEREITKQDGLEYEYLPVPEGFVPKPLPDVPGADPGIEVGGDTETRVPDPDPEPAAEPEQRAAAPDPAVLARAAGLVDDKPAAPERSLSRAEEVAVGLVRDFARMSKGEFSPAQVEAGTKLPKAGVLAALEYLCERGETSDESPAPDMPLFCYVHPKDAHVAAAAHAKRGVGPVPTRGKPVPGTGKPLKISHPDVRALVQAAQGAGATVEVATNTHFEVTAPTMTKRILISGTPRSSRSVMTDRARLRDAGLAV